MPSTRHEAQAGAEQHKKPGRTRTNVLLRPVSTTCSHERTAQRGVHSNNGRNTETEPQMRPLGAAGTKTRARTHAHPQINPDRRFSAVQPARSCRLPDVPDKGVGLVRQDRLRVDDIQVHKARRRATRLGQ